MLPTLLAATTFKIYASFNLQTSRALQPIKCVGDSVTGRAAPIKIRARGGRFQRGFVNIKITALTFGDGQRKQSKSPLQSLCGNLCQISIRPSIPQGERRKHLGNPFQLQPASESKSKPVIETRGVTETVIRNETNCGKRAQRQAVSNRPAEQPTQGYAFTVLTIACHLDPFECLRVNSGRDVNS